LEAALCSTLTFIDANYLMTQYYSSTDWKEVGLPKEKVASWWASHKKKDAARRKRELRARKAQEAEQAAVQGVNDLYKELAAKTWRECSPSEQNFMALFYQNFSDSKTPWTSRPKELREKLKAACEEINGLKPKD